MEPEETEELERSLSMGLEARQLLRLFAERSLLQCHFVHQ
jgi:hypothetical protein